MRIPKTILCNGNIYHVYRVDGEAFGDRRGDFTYADVNYQKHVIRLRNGVKRTVLEEGFFHELIHLCENEDNNLSEKVVDDLARRLYDIFQKNNLLKPNIWRIPRTLKVEAHSLEIVRGYEEEFEDWEDESIYYDIDKSLLRIRIKKGLKRKVAERIFFLAIMELCDSETHPMKINIREEIASNLFTILTKNNIIKLRQETRKKRKNG